MTGFVYLATNNSMPDLVKIGMTGDVPTRMRELSAPTGVVGQYVCMCCCQVENAKNIETQMHHAFLNKREPGERETFRMDWLIAAGFLLVLAVAEKNNNIENQIPNSDISPSKNPAIMPAPVETVDNGIQREKFIEFMLDPSRPKRIKSKSTAKTYANRLNDISNRYLNERHVYDITEIQEAQSIQDNFGINGKWYPNDGGFRAAAMGQYVAFLEFLRNQRNVQ